MKKLIPKIELPLPIIVLGWMVYILCFFIVTCIPILLYKLAGGTFDNKTTYKGRGL